MNNFKTIKTIDLSEINCKLTELIHQPTGATVMHIGNDDPENVFCLSFQTLPDCSNGVAHILEHTVLCGSKKFPVKDPFFSMTRRSLNTFMNAFTGSDFTCYPAATQVPKDFYNLLDVYIDAVFYPNLKELSFLQEGHRLEIENGKLVIKGIVFNEMKGAMASPERRVNEAMAKGMFPDITYGVNSGGKPECIPSLTYQKLIDFHKTYYHPSRCLFYFYGNLPLDEHLEFLESRLLNKVKPAEQLPPVPLQPRFHTAKKLEVSYPFSLEDDPKDKTIYSLGWLTCPISEQKEILALNILTIVLLSTDASPLKRALLKSGLCTQVYASLEDEINEVPFEISLHGVNPDNVEKLKTILLETLREQIRNGISKELVESAIHQIELDRLEITGDSYPYGLYLFLKAVILKQHGVEPETALCFESLCAELRQTLAEHPRYLEEILQKHILDNGHLVEVVATPDQEITKKENEEERNKLELVEKELSEEDKEAITEKAKELAEFQKTEDILDSLPKIAIVDVPKESVDYTLNQENIDHFTIYHHDTFTNNLIYAELIFPLPKIKEEDLPLVKIFSRFLSQMGAGGRTWQEQLEFMQAYTGGVSAGEELNIQAESSDSFAPYFTLTGKALRRNSDKLFKLMTECVTSADFSDKERLHDLMTKHFAALEKNYTNSALNYAIKRAGSALSSQGKVSDNWGGLSYYEAVKKLAQNWEKEANNFMAKMQEFQKSVLCLKNPELVITCDQNAYNGLKKNRFYGLIDIEARNYDQWENHLTPITIAREGHPIAAPVAFSCKMLKGVSYVHPNAPALSVAAKLLTNTSLHTLIREQGGAYGGGAMNNPLEGRFAFYAYRDPNINATFKAFDTAVEKVIKGDFDDEDLDEAKLKIIQALDNPISPGSRGSVAHSWMKEGKTLKVRQAYRDQVLGLTRDQVVDVVKKYLEGQSGVEVIFAGRELMEREGV